MNLQIAIVSDEIANSFTEAVTDAMSWGVTRFEVRNLRSGRVPYISKEEFTELQSLQRNEPITITALSPGMFKLHVMDRAAIDSELTETLPATIELADKLGVKMIIVFGFKRAPIEERMQHEIAIERLHRAAAISAEAGITLVVENEPGFLCDSGSQTAALIERAAHPNLKANWDPANAFGCDEPVFPDGYLAVRRWIGNVHVKDTRLGSLIECLPLGEGVIPWREQLAVLVTDLTLPHLTIETHCHPLKVQSHANVMMLRRLLGDFVSEEQG